MPTLRIVSINDVYTLEHLPRLKSLVRRQLRDAPADVTLVVLAGDFCAPSLLSSLDAGRGMVDCMNDVGVTHATFGNHEDDIPTAELRRRVGELRGKWLSTNVRFDGTHETDVVDVAGVRVGLLGVVMADRAVYREAPFGGAAIEPANESALRAAAALTKSGCAFVVPLTHQPVDDDRALASAGLASRFPVIVGGHEHTPVLERVGGTWIVKAGSDATAAVVTDVTFDGERPPVVTAKLESVDGYPEDAELLARVATHMRKVTEIQSASLVLLKKGETLSSVGTRRQQTTLGTLLCSEIREALGADACLFNGGGIRANRDYQGRFTFGDLETEVPFANEIVVVPMPGRVVRDAVVASRARAPAESGSFLQIGDALDLAHVDDAREYRVAIVRNLLDGMDHIEPLVRFAKEHPERVPPAGTGRDVKHVLASAFAVELWHKLGGFDALDTDHDGRVTEADIAAALSRVTHEAPSHVAAQLLWRVADKNSDGTVTPSEFQRLVRPT